MNNNCIKHDEIIKKSHERSKKYGIEKERVVSRKMLTAGEVASRIKNNIYFINIAAPFMTIIYDILRDSGFMMILTDNEGCILNLIGDDEMIKAASELNMVLGTYMDERSIGTNAMGTAIKENVPIQISAREHFITAYHRWTCSAAPIHNSNGDIIGTLNLTGSSEKVHSHTLGLVVAAVKSIENQIKSNFAQNKLIEIYQYMNTIIDSISFGIIAVDINGCIKSINKTACNIVNLEEKYVSDKSIDSILSNWKDIHECILSNKRYQDEEVIFVNKSIKGRYNIDTYPIKNDKRILGTVITIKDIQKVINLVNKYTGMRARYTFDDIIYGSSNMRRLIKYSKNVSSSPSTILITGESGTGKEVLAQAIHNCSSRKEYGFVAINCGAIPKNLIESELFGYDDGAFTGGRRGGHPGKFELADNGTLFLDEIAEMKLDMQVNLLRVLQEGCFTRVGGSKYIQVDVRIIAATNKDLKLEVEKGNFREDLYYRLSVIPIKIPPLRERKEDIPLLIDSFLKTKALKLNKNIPKISDEMYKRLLTHKWVGNIRELENYIENIVNFNGKTTFEIESEEKKIDTNQFEPLTLDEIQKKAIISSLKRLNGNISKVSRELGISRNTLYCKIKKYGIKI